MEAEQVFEFFFLIIIGYTIVSWLAMGLLLKLATDATVRLALANLLIGVGVYFSMQRTDATGWVTWNVADLLVLIGIMYYRAGLNLMMQNVLNRREPFYASLVMLAAYLLLQPGLDSFRGYVIAFSASAAYVFLMTGVDIHRWHRIEGYRFSAWIFSWPFWMMTLIFLVNVFRALFDQLPNTILQEPFSQNIWWTYVVFILLINSYMVIIGTYRLIQRIRFLADHDSLTGVWNHRSFKLEMKKNHDQRNQCTSVIFVDLDNFKQINDQYGHAIGDEVLMHAVAIMGAQLEPDDILGRLGGGGVCRAVAQLPE